MKKTIYDVAKLARVSPSTVSRVINQRPEVNAKTARRVQAALSATDFRPRWKATPLKSVGLVVHPHRGCLADPFVSNLISSIAETLFAENYVIELIAYAGNDMSPERIGLLAATHSIQGVIIVPMHQIYGLNERLEEESIKLPHVIVGSEPVTGEKANYSVGSDDFGAGQQAAKLLLRQGHRRFVTVSPNLEDYAHRRRVEGIKEAILDFGANAEHLHTLESEDVKVDHGEAAAVAIMTAAEQPDAVLVTNSQLAMGFAVGCRKMGINIPGELSIVGFEENGELMVTGPPLTAVCQPVRKMGETAVQLILDQIQHPEKSVQSPGLLKHILAIRESTRQR